MNATVQFALALGLAIVHCGCQNPNHSAQTNIPAPSVTSTTNSSSHSIAAAATYGIPDPLVSLNKLFLEAYKNRQAMVRTNIEPLIVADFSSLVLYWHGIVETNRCIPDIYHALKTVSHVPFGIFLQIEPYTKEGDPRVPDTVLQALKAYQAQIGAAANSLMAAGFSAEQLVRQEQILKASLSYLTNVLKTARAPRSELISFARSAGPLLLANANDAAAAELELTHAAVMKWKEQIPSADWKRLVVVVRGPQMPRRMNILTQYFARVLAEPAHDFGYPLESPRLIYAEFIPSGRDHLDLVATTFIDGDASEAFFGDRWRMSRDLLADGAEEWLNAKRINLDQGDSHSH